MSDSNQVIGVRCNTQEEWDNVDKKASCNFRSSSFTKDKCCIIFPAHKSNGGLDFYDNERYKIITYEEYIGEPISIQPLLFN